MNGTRSPSPCSNNYDFTLRYERVKLFAQVLKKFDTNIARTSQAMREIITCFALVGQSYQEVSLCVNNTNPNSTANRGYNISHNNRLVENYGADLHNAAKIFSSELTKVKDGQAYMDYNEGIHKNIFKQLHTVADQARKVCRAGDAVSNALKKYTQARRTAEKKETKYQRLGRPLAESKRHPKQAAKRDSTEKVYKAKLNFFNTEYEVLMQRHLYVTGHTIDHFLDLNVSYLAFLMQVLGCLAPSGPRTVERMIAEGANLGRRMGVAPEKLLDSKIRRPAAPGPAGDRVRHSTHNFTDYYGNRTDDDGAVEGPRTARDVATTHLEESEDEPQPVPPIAIAAPAPAPARVVAAAAATPVPAVTTRPTGVAAAPAATPTRPTATAKAVPCSIANPLSAKGRPLSPKASPAVTLKSRPAEAKPTPVVAKGHPATPKAKPVPAAAAVATDTGARTPPPMAAKGRAPFGEGSTPMFDPARMSPSPPRGTGGLHEPRPRLTTRTVFHADPEPRLTVASSPIAGPYHLRARLSEPFDDEDTPHRVGLRPAAAPPAARTSLSSTRRRSQPNRLARPLFTVSSTSGTAGPGPALGAHSFGGYRPRSQNGSVASGYSDGAVTVSSMSSYPVMPSAPPPDTASESDELNSTLQERPTTGAPCQLTVSPLPPSNSSGFQEVSGRPSIAFVDVVKEGRPEDADSDARSTNAMTPETNGTTTPPPYFGNTRCYTESRGAGDYSVEF